MKIKFYHGEIHIDTYMLEGDPKITKLDYIKTIIVPILHYHVCRGPIDPMALLVAEIEEDYTKVSKFRKMVIMLSIYPNNLG